MSAAIKEAAVNEALELSYLFRQNAALDRGLPSCDKPAKITGMKADPPPNVTVNNQIPVPEVKIENQLPAAPAAPNSPSPGATVAADTAKRSLVKTVAPWLLGATLGSAAGPAAWWLMRDDQPVVEPQARDGSLLQYLEDQGLHLPEGTWKAN